MLTSNYFDTNSSTLNPIRNELYKIEFGDQRSQQSLFISH